MGKTYSIGLIVSPAEIQHNMAMFVAMAKLLRAVEHPSSFDWRSIEGEDFTTPIRDQGKCSSSVAFATIALMESMIKIANQDPKLQPDLSEAYLFPRGGGKCESGAQFGRMLTAAESGVCDELCCPYAGDWKPCPDFKSRLTAITFSETIFSPEQAKAHIASTGPLMSGMAVWRVVQNQAGRVRHRLSFPILFRCHRLESSSSLPTVTRHRRPDRRHLVCNHDQSRRTRCDLAGEQ